MELLLLLMAGILGATILELTRGATHAMLIGLCGCGFSDSSISQPYFSDGIIAAVLFKTTSLAFVPMLIATLVGTLIRRAIISWHVCGVVDIGKRIDGVCIIQPLVPAAVAFAAGRLSSLLHTGRMDSGPYVRHGGRPGRDDLCGDDHADGTGTQRTATVKTAFQRLRLHSLDVVAASLKAAMLSTTWRCISSVSSGNIGSESTSAACVRRQGIAGRVAQRFEALLLMQADRIVDLGRNTGLLQVGLHGVASAAGDTDRVLMVRVLVVTQFLPEGSRPSQRVVRCTDPAHL